MFVFIALLLIAVALLVLLPPLIGKSKVGNQSNRQANIAITRQRLEDIDLDAAEGLIATDLVEAIQEEAATELLQQSPPDSVEKKNTGALFENRWWTILIVIFIPVFTFLIYVSVGTPAALLESGGQSVQQSGQQLDQLVKRLQQRLEENPDDAKGWMVLAQTSMALERYEESVTAMENLYRLQPGDPDVLSRYAEALVLADRGRFNDQASKLVEQSLATNPQHVHSLWLAGIEAYQAERFADAIEFLTQAKHNAQDAQDVEQINELIQASTFRLQDRADVGVDSDVGIEVHVDIDASLKAAIKPTDSVFVFAKAVQGPALPLAVSRHQASELPLTLRLSDAMAMSAEHKLSGFDQVMVTARLSASHQPSAQPGDLQGDSGVLNLRSVKSTTIIINQKLE